MKLRWCSDVATDVRRGVRQEPYGASDTSNDTSDQLKEGTWWPAVAALMDGWIVVQRTHHAFEGPG
jgi:hypothetical protein